MAHLSGTRTVCACHDDYNLDGGGGDLCGGGGDNDLSVDGDDLAVDGDDEIHRMIILIF